MQNKRTIPRVCQQCSAGFLATTSQVNAGRAHCCSAACESESRRTRNRLPIVLSEDGITARIPLCARDGSVRAYALVDAADADWVNQWRWHLHHTGYANRSQAVGGKRVSTFSLHRELLGLVPGGDLEGDHINRDRLDNRRDNLRILPKEGHPNAQNKSSARGSTSAYRGVSWSTTRNRWVAAIMVKGKDINLGFFDDEETAAEAARNARLHYMPFSTE